MRAALVTRFDTPPRYAEVEEPRASGAHETVVEVLAASVSPRVRSQASGSHYTSTGALPLVPGIDGVGRMETGELRYFILPDTDRGSLAEKTVIDLRRSVPVPHGSDPVQLAAAMNPAMSSWIGLRHRAHLRPGASVLVLGATGSAGALALQVARRLGAARVTAVGRDIERVADAGADALVDLSDTAGLSEAGRRVDVVLDYLWGEPAADTLRAIVPHRDDDGQTLTWVQIGSVAGPEAPIPSAALRAVDLVLVGSGQGSVSTGDIVADLGDLAREVAAGAFATQARAVPLAEVERAWHEAATTRDRLVLVP
ncbi:MAG: zinc-binding alcohol dehydrogenase family protein [Leifsonia sp.]